MPSCSLKAGINDVLQSFDILWGYNYEVLAGDYKTVSPLVGDESDDRPYSVLQGMEHYST